MKKIIALLLSAFWMLASAASVAAESVTDIVVSSEDMTITIDVKTTVSTDKLTLKVTDETSVLYVKQEKAPKATDENGVHAYQFKFTAAEGTKSGEYKVTVGGVGTTVSETVKLVSNADKIAFYQELNDVAPEAMKGYLEKNGLFVPGDIKDYLRLDKDMREQIDVLISDMEFTVSDNGDNLKETDKTFSETFAEIVLMANLVQEDDAVLWDGYVKIAIADYGFEGSYYEKSKPETVLKYFNEEKGSIETDKVEEAFDSANLLAVCESFNATVLRDALELYEKRKTVQLDFAEYGELSKNDKLSVCEFIKDETPENMEDFAKALEDAVEDVQKNETSSGGSSSSGGGGGGSSAGNRNPSTVGVSKDKETTPETVKPQLVSFSDMESASWAKEAVTYLADKGFVSGRGEGIFAPNEFVTREEFVKMLVEAFRYGKAHADVSFDDVPENRWSYPYVSSAFAVGIVTGMSENTFGATENISRQDMAVMMSRVLKLADMDGTHDVAAFSDEGAIADYAKDAVNMLTSLCIINGMGDGSFVPRAFVTRAQAAKVIYETLMLIQG